MKWLFWTIVHGATVVILASGVMTVVDVKSSNAQSNRKRSLTVVESATSERTEYSVNAGAVNLGSLSDKINQLRSTHNLPPLEYSSKLVDIANLRVKNMLDGDYYGHIGTDGKSVVDIAGSSLGEGVFICENLALESTLDENTYIDGWFRSDRGHRECMMASNVKSAGYATVKLYDSDLGPHYAVVAVYSAR